jgi:hypothetical protein
MAKRDAGLRFQPSGGTRTAQVPTGKKQRLSIERLANDGRGIAFVEGRTSKPACSALTARSLKREPSECFRRAPCGGRRRARISAAVVAAALNRCPMPNSLP